MKSFQMEKIWNIELVSERVGMDRLSGMPSWKFTPEFPLKNSAQRVDLAWSFLVQTHKKSCRPLLRWLPLQWTFLAGWTWETGGTLGMPLGLFFSWTWPDTTKWGGNESLWRLGRSGRSWAQPAGRHDSTLAAGKRTAGNTGGQTGSVFDPGPRNPQFGPSLRREGKKSHKLLHLVVDKLKHPSLIITIFHYFFNLNSGEIADKQWQSTN